MNKQQPQQQFNVDINNTTEFVCPECEHTLFKENYMIRKLSALLSPTGTESFIPINVLACAKCGTVPEQFMPKLQ